MTADQKVLEAFYEMISESKQVLYDRIASERTKFITVVLENIRKEHNASAVIRTCDCFGIQDLHAIEKNNKYVVHKDIALGADSWVNTYSHDSKEEPSIKCLEKLKGKGYRIVATTPHTDKSINSLSVKNPIALVFGTEQKGISKEVELFADELIKIPMYGFTESFNISVSAAIALNILRSKLETEDIEWKLSEEEQVKLKIEWCSKIIKDGTNVEKEIRRRVYASETE